MKADKGVIPKAVEEKLVELGNPTQAIPFYAIYGPGRLEPVTLEALITHSMVQEAIKTVGSTQSESTVIAAKQ